MKHTLPDTPFLGVLVILTAIMLVAGLSGCGSAEERRKQAEDDEFYRQYMAKEYELWQARQSCEKKMLKEMHSPKNAARYDALEAKITYLEESQRKYDRFHVNSSLRLFLEVAEADLNALQNSVYAPCMEAKGFTEERF